MAQKIPADLRYTKQHEWARVEGELLVVGITDYAQEALGDIVYVDVGASGTELDKDASFGAIESVKAAEDLYAPVAGTIAETNEELKSAPEKINQAPYEHWLVKLSGFDKSEVDGLLDAAAYGAYLESLG
ncbi:MAG: glycine cleavage system protein GcvH [Spirochaetales bacterium]|nr:glycine cleavage system protein GcvH [Leptospiraceae bacterium]MCP5482478.1 glycine cleavage system protein GcvH [Spirochaetales bacterium]MCP5485818.1 glycine cleavage system protein GcvH [Spirochaetales bacterium]